MDIRKKNLVEIIDDNGDLIGLNNIPSNGSDLESQASNTTDYNAKIGTQPFRYDMLGRFGFTLMPFMEGKEEQVQDDLIGTLDKILHDEYSGLIEHYYRNPNKLKSDYRKYRDDNSIFDGAVKTLSKKIVGLFEKHLEKLIKPLSTIDESKVVEDKMVDKKSSLDIGNKTNDNDIRDKKLEKIADLINKLNKNDINKIIKLLEVK